VSIVLSQVSKRFGRHVVVDRVNLEVLDGELFVLLGPSGSGKSTVLRMIAGLAFPDEGKIMIHGSDVTHAPPQQRGIGFVFQNYSIFTHMTVAANIEFGLKIRGMGKVPRIRRTEELLEIVGLAGLGHRMPRQLSGGQQQRVALARALAYQPKVLLLDEPFGALDVKIRAHLRRTLSEVQKRLKVTAILVTHDQDEAFEVADRIGVLDRGRLLETGDPEKLYRCPRSAFVAIFLGGGNLLSAPAGRAEALLGPIATRSCSEMPREESQMAHIFFRPEQVRLTKEPPADGKPVLGRGVIADQVFSGSFRRVRVRVPRLRGWRQLAPPPSFGQEQWILEAELPAETSLEPGEQFVSVRGWTFLNPPRPRLLVFDNRASEGISHLAMGGWLASRLDGSVTVLRNRKDQERDEKVRDEVQRRLTEAGVQAANVLLPEGKSSEVLIREQTAHIYNFLLLTRSKADAKMSHLGIARMLTRILEGAEVPLLITARDFKPIERILVCTAAGEPGKTDVRMAAWLARRVRASVTLLHVLTPNSNDASAREHVANAASTLGSLDVHVDTRLVEAQSPAEAIVREAAQGDWDLLVLGGHGPHAGALFEPEDVTLQVLKQVDCSVLVVPDQEQVS